MNTVEPLRDPRKIASIKKMLKGDNPRDYLLFVMGVNTALRIGDLLRLRVGDVLDEHGAIKNTLRLREQKTGRERTIRLNQPVKDALALYFNARSSLDYDHYLFTAAKTPTKPLNRTFVYRQINRWCEDVGLTDGAYGTHTLRKTWGYQARKYQGVPIELIQAKLGHRSPAVTRRYIGISQDEIEDLEERVEI